MFRMKILNLYAGIGGNRKLWPNHNKIVAIEINKKIADEYKNNYPNDEIIVTDAHKFLLDNYEEFDFIWSSPPCQTHSNVNNFLNAQGCKRYPDMKLYQEILLLNCFHKGKWVIENVITYYTPLLKPFEVDRHYFWSNFIIPSHKFKSKRLTVTNSRESTRRTSKEHKKNLQEYHNINSDNLQALKNCVNPKLGLYIWNCAFNMKQEKIIN